MGHLSNRNIIIGICGGIAAYKSAELVRLLTKAGATVKVVMTRGAREFITPLTLQALSGNPVHTELLDEDAEAGMGHIELARWADALLIAPATADVIARLASGRADDLLTTLALATPAPWFVAPAMNQQMWQSPATLANVDTLRKRGTAIIGPDAGEQACGDIGPGRLLEPEHIVAAMAQYFPNQLLAGRRVVITAGPTREALDPVRYLTNHSSGKMGFAIAAAAAAAGAEVQLIAGPVALETPEQVSRTDVISAEDMHLEATRLGAGADVFIAAAAVADYRPQTSAPQKIKRSGDVLTLELVPNTDIVATVATGPNRPLLVVGFAAETENVVEHAQAKLARKRLDVVVANDVSDSDIGFNSDRNAVTLISSNSEESLGPASKRVIAEQLIARIADRVNRESPHAAAGAKP